MRATTTAIEAPLSPAAMAAVPDADWTIREIAQQPEMWRRAIAAIDVRRAEVATWLAPLLARPKLRIILTGAGTSAYAGQMLAPALTEALGRPVEAIATTDIVAAPRQYLLPETPTLLVSFARSGSSPESVAAVDLTEQLVKDAHHLILCCNPDSQLARQVVRDGLCLLMPPETLDRSFAMTSSVTSMVVSLLALLAPDAEQAALLGKTVDHLLETPLADVAALVGNGLERVIFLGSGALQGVATEAALKCVELSAGRTCCFAESSLGLRHGPKFVVDAHSKVISLTAADPYIRRYDQDMAAELENDQVAHGVVRLDRVFPFAGAQLKGLWLGLAYLVWCQLLAWRNALAHGVTPDNPAPDGMVNRVVQGVTIHPFDPMLG